MTKFAFIYHGGSMPESQEEGAKIMAAWGAWMEGIGSALIDGGNPFGTSTTVNADGSTSDDGGANPASGYSLVEAADLNEALAHAKGCPILDGGGSVEVCEAMAM